MTDYYELGYNDAIAGCRTPLDHTITKSKDYQEYARGYADGLEMIHNAEKETNHDDRQN